MSDHPAVDETSWPKMHPDEVCIHAGLVQALVADQFPDWADLEISSVASAGTVNAIYRLGPDLAVRLPRAATYATEVEDDVAVLSRLSGRLPLQIPEIVAVGAPGPGYPFAWGVYRWIQGRSWAESPPSDLDQAASDLADFVEAMQDLDPSGVRPGYRGRPLKLVDEYVRAAIARSAELIPVAAVTEAWKAALAVPDWAGPSRWFHGDLLPTNLLVEDGRLAAVIDFGCSGVGDPAVEYSSAWALFPSQVLLRFRELVATDENTWRRARGWALASSVQAYGYYLETNPMMAAIAKVKLDAVLADGDTQWRP